MARLTDRQFLKAQIDLEPLGLIMDGPFEAYFCTPKGARIFARSGVDGIHFCFVRGFGETVFAVSPMNGRENCVHPVAKSFRDFLRLLLALHDAAAIEQAWQWNAAQLEEFEQKHPSSDEQLAALDKLVFTFHLRPMAEPWKYIHTVQSGFDYGKLRFSEEFYDDDTPDMTDEPWQVTFEGTFWGAHGKPGKELRLGASFSWAGDEWLVPAAYVCREGIVLDLCKRVLPKAKAVVTMGTCAAYGGVQAAKPNPTGSVGVNDCFARLGMDVKAINIPGCPPNPLNLVGTLVAFLQNKEIKLDDLGRPLMFYGQSVHDLCERRVHFEAGEFAPSFDSEEARKGWCLYDLGCKGPSTYNNCPKALFNETNWPVRAGHPCIGCSEPNFWDDLSPFYQN